MVLNYHTHSSLTRLTKNCSIHIHLIARNNWSYPRFLHVVLQQGDRVIHNLKFIQQHPSFLHYQSCRLPWASMSNCISIMLHTPCIHEEHLQNIIPHMLEKYKIPHQMHKFIILDSMSFETNVTQTSQIASRSQKICPLVSLLNPHASHVLSSITYR